MDAHHRSNRHHRPSLDTSVANTSTSTHDDYAPQSPTIGQYAPESPKLDLYTTTPVDDQPLQKRQKYRGSISHPVPTPFSPGADATAAVGAYGSPTQTHSSPYSYNGSSNAALGYHGSRNNSASSAPAHPLTMPTRSARMKREAEEDEEWTPQGARGASSTAMRLDQPAYEDAMDTKDDGEDDGADMKMEPVKIESVKMESETLAPGVAEGIEVKTKFPAARIKRIMQADEDVGKVAQVTPHVVAKALELFMISLVTRAASEAKGRSSKRVSAAHLKQAVLSDSHFDFLSEVIGKVPDAPPPAADRGSPEEPGEGKKQRKPRTTRKRKDSEET